LELLMYHSLNHDLQPLRGTTLKRAQSPSSHGTTPPLVPKTSMAPKKSRLCHNTTNFLSPVSIIQQVTLFAKSPQSTRYNTRTTTHPSQTAPNTKHARNNTPPPFLFHLHHTRPQARLLLAAPRRQRLPLPMVLVQVHSQQRNLCHNRNVDDGAKSTLFQRRGDCETDARDYRSEDT